MGRRRVTREFKLEAAASATLGAGTANRRSDQDIVLTTSVQWLGCCVRLESVAMSAPARRKDDVIQIRTSAEAKAILNWPRHLERCRAKDSRHARPAQHHSGSAWFL